MAKKADAWKEYREAAMVDMMLEVMPKVAAEVAAPLSKANKITMVADSNGELGASKLTAEASSDSVSSLKIGLHLVWFIRNTFIRDSQKLLVLFFKEQVKLRINWYDIKMNDHRR